MSYVSLANNLEGVNYSSIRQGTLEERDITDLTKIHDRPLHYANFRKMAITSHVIKDGFLLPPDKYSKFADNVEFNSRSLVGLTQ